MSRIDPYFCEQAELTCRSAIRLLIDLWPANYQPGEELRETLQGLQGLQDFFTAEAWDAEAQELQERRHAAPSLDLAQERAKLAAADERIARAEASLQN